jgi:hypothetical protein
VPELLLKSLPGSDPRSDLQTSRVSGDEMRVRLQTMLHHVSLFTRDADDDALLGAEGAPR